MANIIDFIRESLNEDFFDLSSIHREIADITSRYPKEKFLTMKMEEWVKLGDPYCFINMIENKTDSIASGFLGFNRNRLFYQGKTDPKPLIIKAISGEKRFAGMSDEKIFSHYMQDLYDFIDTFDPDNYVATDFLYGANVIKAKIAMIYCEGHKICGFTSRNHAAKMAEYLGVPVDKKDDTLGLNIKINKYLIEKDPELENLNNYILGRLIWDFYEEFVMIKKNVNNEFLVQDRKTDAFIIEAVEKAKLPKELIEGPEPAPKPQMEKGALRYARRPEVSKYALYLAGYQCECGKDHPSFIRKSDGKNYTEPHHIIPMSAQGSFDAYLDCYQNIISLCSTCHNKLHYGVDIEPILKEIYDNRIASLNSKGIFITFEELLSYYK